MKKLLIETMRKEQDLYGFCIECLNKIYGEEAPTAIEKFEEGIDFFDLYGCIQSLSYIDRNIQKEAKEMREMRALHMRHVMEKENE